METNRAESPRHPFDRLQPEVVLEAAEAVGLMTDGRLLALNSYENRVWQIGIDEATPVIAKFYRPGRWSNAAIAEEHEFAAELAAELDDAGLSVVAPLAFDGRTLLEHGGMRSAVPADSGIAAEFQSKRSGWSRAPGCWTSTGFRATWNRLFAR